MAQDIVRQIHKLLIKNGKTIAIAESCSGGILSSLLTRISGSSRYFILGAITYSNTAKKIILRIPYSLIRRYGAVSKPIAELMAQSIRKLGRTDFGVSITGVAGPSGATAQKPLGTVFVAIDSKNKKVCKKYRFTGNRNTVRRKSAVKALELLRRIM